MSAIAVGDVVADVRGNAYLVAREFTAGAQGGAYLVRGPGGKELAAKVLHPHVATPEAARRLDALIALDLPSRSPALAAPTVRLDPRHGLGALMPAAEGEPLEEVITSSRLGLVEGLGLGAVLGRALAEMEAVGFGHGDIAASNVVVARRAGYLDARLIDFDNFVSVARGCPEPAFDGQELYAAPEILAGRSKPGIAGDRFALAVLLHEVLLHRHPFAGIHDGRLRDDVVRAMQAAAWPDDPYAAASARTPPGATPVGVLPADVHDLFRRALQAADPRARPSAAECARTCEDALGNVYACEGCGESFVNQPTRYACPWCGERAAAYVLDMGIAKIPLVAMATVVGRDQLGGSTMVSRRHAAFERRGFGLRVTDLSANRTAVCRRGRWTELGVGDAMDVGAGDTVKFSDGVVGQIAKDAT